MGGLLWTCPYCKRQNVTLITIRAKQVQLGEAYRYSGALTCQGCGVQSTFALTVELPLSLPVPKEVLH